jgi:hypothetical protein
MEGTVYAFVPTFVADDKTTIEAHRVDAPDIPVRTTARVVAANAAFVSYAITLSSDQARVRIKVGDETAEYEIIPWSSGTPPGSDLSVHPTAAKHVVNEWTCSFADHRTVTLSNSAPAYEVHYATDLDALHRGELTKAIMPTNMNAFWGSEPATPSISLGHSDCFGWTAKEADVQGNLYMKVKPLYTAGDVGRWSGVYEVTRDSVWLKGTADLSDVVSEQPRGCGLLARDFIHPREQAVKASDTCLQWKWRAWLAGAILGIGFAAGFTRRRRGRYLAILGFAGLGATATMAVLSVVMPLTALVALLSGVLIGLGSPRRRRSS